MLPPPSRSTLSCPPAQATRREPDETDWLSDWRVNLVLFLATAASVGYVGETVWDNGWQFAAALLSVLVAHEAGHYLAARVHGEPASLPFFLPLPFLNPFGTLGAVLVLDERVASRRALLDIGAAGPLAGMAVAVPLMIHGLSLSPVRDFAGTGAPYIQEGQSLLYLALKHVTVGPIPEHHDVALHPIALAAWAGFFITFLNLLPVGQLDGGHIAHALFGRSYGRFTGWVGLVPVVTLLVNLGVFGCPMIQELWTAAPPTGRAWNTLVSALAPWVLMSGLVIVMWRRDSLRHPLTEDERPPGLGRWLVGLFTLLLYVGLFMPFPWVVH